MPILAGLRSHLSAALAASLAANSGSMSESLTSAGYRSADIAIGCTGSRCQLSSGSHLAKGDLTGRDGDVPRLRANINYDLAGGGSAFNGGMRLRDRLKTEMARVDARQILPASISFVASRNISP